jgi:hypothetical protein
VYLGALPLKGLIGCMDDSLINPLSGSTFWAHYHLMGYPLTPCFIIALLPCFIILLCLTPDDYTCKEESVARNGLIQTDHEMVHLFFENIYYMLSFF